MRNIFDAAFDRKLAKVRKENETDPVADYNKKALIKAVSVVAVACAATVAFVALTKAAEEGNIELSN
jgi:hypothetical protein